MLLSSITRGPTTYRGQNIENTPYVCFLGFAPGFLVMSSGFRVQGSGFRV